MAFHMPRANMHYAPPDVLDVDDDDSSQMTTALPPRDLAARHRHPPRAATSLCRSGPSRLGYQMQAT